jgi:hypothetical protein
MPDHPGVAQPDNPSKLKFTVIIIFRPPRGQAKPLGQQVQELGTYLKRLSRHVLSSGLLT